MASNNVFLHVNRRVGLVEVLLGLLDWRAGGRHGLCAQMKWNESEASIGRVLAVEVKLLLKVLCVIFSNRVFVCHNRSMKFQFVRGIN